jgi:hypothetical protein
MLVETQYLTNSRKLVVSYVDKSGDIKLPKFQRIFVWDKSDILNRTDITNEHKVVLLEQSLFNSFQKLNIDTDEKRELFIDDFFKNILNEETAKEIRHRNGWER